MQDIWSGSYFENNSFVPSQFFTDTSGNVFFFEQNYCTFYPVTVGSDGTASLSNSTAATVAPNTSLTSDDSLADQVSNMNTAVIKARQSSFNAQSVLSSVTQQGTSLVNTAIENALASNQNLVNALAVAAPLLTSPEFNFALQDIASGWKNGQQILSTLGSLINNHQLNIAGAQKSIQSVKDFKTKILKQVLDAGDSVRKLQGQLDAWKSQNTMQALTQAFPETFGPFNQLLQNQEAELQKEIASLLPSCLATQVGGEVGGFISNIFNQVGGSVLPVIFNPIDKLFTDINYLTSEADSLIQQIPVDGFGNLETQSQTCNEVAALLNNLIAKVPVKPTVPSPPAPATSSGDIYQAATSYIQQQFQQTVNSVMAEETANIKAIIAKNKISPTPPPADPSDSYLGGSLSSLQQIAALVPPVSVAPPTIDTSNISISPDPQIALNQSNRAAQQTKANAPGTQRNVKRGDCINNIADVPLKPRSYPADGSLGDYMGSQTIPF